MPDRKNKERLDSLLLQRDLAVSHKEAQALILSGRVLVDDQRVDKPGTLVPSSSQIRIKSPEIPYVSRGGLKLEGAIRQLKFPVVDRVCLDLGASTGGFTDCLLQHGARRVYAFDVGRGQLDWRLQQDPRVTVRDGVNVRYLKREMVAEPIELITIDLSFISLRQILPSLQAFEGADIVALVKPQYEARPEEVEAGGLITDPQKREEIVSRVRQFTRELGFEVLGEAPSSVAGQKGNIEYFLWFRT